MKLWIWFTKISIRLTRNLVRLTKILLWLTRISFWQYRIFFSTFQNLCSVYQNRNSIYHNLSPLFQNLNSTYQNHGLRLFFVFVIFVEVFSNQGYFLGFVVELIFSPEIEKNLEDLASNKSIVELVFLNTSFLVTYCYPPPDILCKTFTYTMDTRYLFPWKLKQGEHNKTTFGYTFSRWSSFNVLTTVPGTWLVTPIAITVAETHCAPHNCARINYLASVKLQQVLMDFSGCNFFHMRELNDISLNRTYFHIRSDFTRLFYVTMQNRVIMW